MYKLGYNSIWNFGGVTTLAAVSAPLVFMHKKGIYKASFQDAIILAGVLTIAKQAQNLLSKSQEEIVDCDSAIYTRTEKGLLYSLELAKNIIGEIPGSVAFVGVYTALANKDVFSSSNLGAAACLPAISLAGIMNRFFSEDLRQDSPFEESEWVMSDVILPTIQLTTFFGMVGRMPNKNYGQVFASAFAAGYVTNILGYTVCKLSGNDKKCDELKSASGLIDWTFIRAFKSSLYAIPLSLDFTKDVLFSSLYEGSCSTISTFVKHEVIGEMMENIAHYAALPHRVIDSVISV